MDNPVKCIFIGDNGVGKTSILNTFITHYFDESNVYSYFDEQETNIQVGNKTSKIRLRELYNIEEFQSLEEYTYNEQIVDIFALCFSIISPESFENVTNKWIIQVKSSFPKIPVILIGTKIDLRTDPTQISQLESQGFFPFDFNSGLQLAKQIGAFTYIECSSKTQENLTQIFEEIARYFNSKRLSSENSKKIRCQII
ncbi:hypothetical protein M0811_03982 [Anaeramoeba ignava]|uniref:Uncharacterized protein n=1 Tax=Anaeramoeba ignava TaxID=1746090 RepID=A0A9Q0LYC2_ANAIG|nr:hypothetical protein M0811_03982 [Anaeramoeba ignava]